MTSTGPSAEEHAWWSHKYTRGAHLADDPAEQIYRAGFRKGASWMFTTSSRLAPYLDDFVRLLEYLADRVEIPIPAPEEDEVPTH